MMRNTRGSRGDRDWAVRPRPDGGRLRSTRDIFFNGSRQW